MLGSKKHCIYDLNQGHLYHISDHVVRLIEKITSYNIMDLNLSPRDKSMINNLENTSLIITSDLREKQDNIFSLRKMILPKFSWIEVTRQCNLSCSFCYEKSNQYCKDRMSLDDFYYVCDELKNNGIERIQLIGGEPLLLGDDLRTMVKYSCRFFHFIELYTNGTLINKDWASFFKQNNISIAISIHSYIPSEHDRLTTVAGSHKNTIRGLNHLNEHNVNYNIACVSNANCDIGEKTRDIKYTLFAKDPKIIGRAHINQYNFDLFKSKAITKKSKISLLNKNRVVKAISGHQCFIKKMYISHKLDVYPCVMERRIKYGNLKIDKFSNLLKQGMIGLSKDHINECKECEFRYSCFDCRPDSNGNGLFEKPWYCTYLPREGRWVNIEKRWQELMGEHKGPVGR